MHIPPMRPTFRITFPLESAEAVRRLSLLLNDDDYPITGRIAGSHLMLVIPPKDRHFWSPWLHIEVEKTLPAASTNHSPENESEQSSMSDEPQASVRGRFSPNPSVWTGFMLAYIALATLIFFACMFGVAQWMMDKPPSSLKLIPFFALIAGAMYWASLIGQRLALKQMHELYEASMNILKSGSQEGESSSPENNQDTDDLDESPTDSTARN